MLSPAGGSCLGRRRPSSCGCGGGRRTHRLSTAAPKHACMNEYLYIYPHESKIMRIHQHINPHTCSHNTGAGRGLALAGRRPGSAWQKQRSLRRTALPGLMKGAPPRVSPIYQSAMHVT